jgi:hypothetical protein
MDRNKRIIAITELVLIFPAALFLAAVVARYLQPLQYAAQQIVTWYAGRIWTLWVLLVSMPLAALLIGGITLLWNASGGTESQSGAQSPAPTRAQLPTRIIVAATLAAGLILAVVGLHVLAN